MCHASFNLSKTILLTFPFLIAFFTVFVPACALPADRRCASS